MNSSTVSRRIATLEDEAEFLSLWRGYLEEGAKSGSLVAATEANLRQYRLLFRTIIASPLQGAVIMAREDSIPIGAGLYGPRMPLEPSDSRSICLGSGTYVIPSHRGRGISALIYSSGFAALRQRGFTHLLGTVDVNNENSLASVLARGMNITSLNFIKEL